MDASNRGMWARLRARRSYTTYSIGCVVAWAIVLGIVSATGSSAKSHDVQILCAGWWIGWLSATIARVVYPPPRRQLWAGRPASPGR
jgi:hypothetical protein